MKGECTVYGVDIWKPYLSFCSKSIRSYDGLILTDANQLPFQPIFDIILATEVLEHMNKKDGLRFIMNAEKLLKKDGLIIISTPHGSQDQDELEGNKWQIHQSIWKKQELIKLGFEVVTSQQVLNTPFGKFFIPFRSIHESGMDKLKNFAFYSLAAFSSFDSKLGGKLIACKVKK